MTPPKNLLYVYHDLLQELEELDKNKQKLHEILERCRHLQESYKQKIGKTIKEYERKWENLMSRFEQKHKIASSFNSFIILCIAIMLPLGGFIVPGLLEAKGIVSD
jgi:DNA repair exonuclease SbcCD ATPase subunit